VVKAEIRSQVPTAPVAEDSALAERAMLVNLSVSVWTARKHDAKVSAAVAAQHGATAKVGRYNKMLVARERLSDLTKLASRVRTVHYELTLPWADEGARILPSALYLQYTSAIGQLRDQFDATADQFALDYPEYQAEQIRFSGTLCEAGEYPSADEIRRKFAVSVKVLPVPTAADFRVQLGDIDRSVIKAQITAQMEETMSIALRDCFRRAYKSVEHMATRLDLFGQDDKSPFRDSLVVNVREMCDLLGSLNVMQDRHLSRMVDEIRDRLTVHTAGDLRIDQTAREKTAAAARDIMSRMSDYIGGGN